MPNDYLVNSTLLKDRDADYDTQKDLCEKFDVDPDQEFPNSSGNINHELYVDKETLECSFHIFDFKTRDTLNDTHVSLWRAIPAPLLLYRLICTFGAVNLKCEGKDGYKMVWHYTVIHKETDTKIVFDEWKGASGFHLPQHTHTELPEAFKDDLVELINYLLSGHCGHPYDGLVAGSVA